MDLWMSFPSYKVCKCTVILMLYAATCELCISESVFFFFICPRVLVADLTSVAPKTFLLSYPVVLSCVFLPWYQFSTWGGRVIHPVKW